MTALVSSVERNERRQRNVNVLLLLSCVFSMQIKLISKLKGTFKMLTYTWWLFLSILALKNNVHWKPIPGKKKKQ